MPKPKKPITTPQPIVLPDTVLYTTIDPISRIHYVECDICHSDIQLTVTAKPYAFRMHRVKCQNENTVHGKIREHMFSKLPGASKQSDAIERDRQCSGYTIKWTAGSIWSTYPYHQHSLRSLPWYPSGFDHDNNTITLRSVMCPMNIPYNKTTCASCDTIQCSSEFSSLKERAENENISPFMPFQYLTHGQQEMHMRNLTEKVKLYRSKYEASIRRFDTSVCRVDDYKRIMMFLASNDVVRLSHLLSTALRRGCSPSAILEKLVQSVEGLYNPRTGFTRREFDLAFLCKALGGPRLLYSFHKAFGLVSERTLKRGGKIPRILVSVGMPSANEISLNIKSFFDESIRPAPSPLDPGDQLPGNTLILDDIALESKCRYCPDRGAIIGLCREHSHNVDASVADLKSLEKIRDLLASTNDDKPSVCLGKNATVVVVAPCAREDLYSPVPIVVSPTDGKERSHSLAKWIQTTLNTWKDHECGARVNGPIWSIASDGDGTFRRARHFICTEQVLEPNSRLGSMLSPLRGLNLHTSSEGITATSDPKHIFKRFATALRSEKGITVQNTVVLPSHTLNFLQEIPGISPENARSLLDPADKQNVPKAVALIQRLMSLRDPAQGATTSTPNPSLMNRRRMLEFVGQFLGYFLRPFIDVELSLGDQLESISTFAHLFAILWLEHKTAFLTAQLYADSQAVVKNLFFTVGRLQIINPNLKFYLIHEGSDRLEGLFADIRTLDHGRNFDIRQLAEKISVATLIHSTYARNPDLDRGHYRLNLTGAIGVDHLNPASWIGDTRVGDVDLQEVWTRGQEKALEVLKEYLPDGAQEYDFMQLFAPESGRDLLRPSGPTSWVGIDDSDEGIAGSNPDDSVINVDPLEVPQDIEDYLPDNIDGDKPSPTHTVHINGHDIAIDSLAANLGTENWKRVTMRTLRVQGRTMEHLSPASMKNWLDAPEADSNLMMKIGDLGAFLTRVDHNLALAIIEVTKFKIGDSGLGTGAVGYTDMIEAGSKISVVGQVCRLMPSNSVEGGWEVIQKFLPVTKRLTASSKPHFIIQVPAKLIQPLSSNLVVSDEAEPHERLRWLLQNDYLTEKMNLLWELLNLDDIDSLPCFQSLHAMPASEYFPYRNFHGDTCFVFSKLPKHLTTTAKFNMKVRMPCFMCNEVVKLKEMRNHVGKHILFTFRDQKDVSVLLGHQVGLEPCGFCGLDGCSLWLSDSGYNSLTVTSSCLYQHDNWNYKAAATGTHLPCTNIPIYCELCPESENGEKRAIWRYNTIVHMILHHEQRHPTLSNTYILPNIPGSMLLDSYISSKEEQAMGITSQATAEYRDDFGMMKSDDPALEAYQDSMPSLLKPKRTRAMTVVETHAKKAKNR